MSKPTVGARTPTAGPRTGCGSREEAESGGPADDYTHTQQRTGEKTSSAPPDQRAWPDAQSAQSARRAHARAPRTRTPGQKAQRCGGGGGDDDVHRDEKLADFCIPDEGAAGRARFPRATGAWAATDRPPTSSAERTAGLDPPARDRCKPGG
ncbi:hypothetical protein EB796_025255 [Bugula neritina]|uniref:Uncharacterized protein n=1 Tax=Bugula neritina TaxID=10212 RepID=A0A7J7IR63_BUGNE|nr:hypothetical protein EB796_025255 [Bugula neritina]